MRPDPNPPSAVADRPRFGRSPGPPIQSTSPRRGNMQGKIGLEEHFAIPETLNDSAGFVPDDHRPELRSRILDIHERRLRLMDEHGMEMMILSLNAPAVQAIPDPKRANEIARR